ncbi:MAG: flagellar biosynthetic protein FliQ [Pseudomonadota bacterium]
MFTGPEILDIARDAIWVALVMAGPVMLIALSIGLSIALLQALTQVQEMTLVFVPKIVAIFFSLLFFLPMMGETIGDLFARLMALVAAG